MAYEPGDDDQVARVSGGGSDGAAAADGDEGRASVVDPEIAVTPPRDAPVVLAQETIILQLEPGWTAELQLEPEGGDPIALPEDELDVTPLNQFVYVPGEGRAVERLPSGRNCVQYTAWDQVRGREATELTDRWCFSVT
jgi:hypothetical protein